jgi:pimeloyl-ACP methyl ester carboxylesterase
MQITSTPSRIVPEAGRLARRCAVTALTIALLALASVTVSGSHAARGEWAIFSPPSGTPLPPAALAVEPVDWTAAGVRIAGWYAPSQNRAAVILAHGSSADRRQLNAECTALAGAGFGVLAFDWPGHGESGGLVRHGTPERAAFEGAVNWLSRRPDVDAKRIGAFGFSVGGAFAVAFSAADPRVAAVAAAGAFSSEIDQTRYEYAHAWPWARAAAVAVSAWRIEGGDFRPIDVAAKLRGRPVLLVAGEADVTVPPAMSRELAQATGGAMWLIPRCGHGQYAQVAGNEYGRRLVRFFADALTRRWPVSHGGPPESRHPRQR